nr:hypothetical protein [uncultured bacterium]
MKKSAAEKVQKKKPVRKPVRRYTVRVYEEATARQLEHLAESTGYREMSAFFVESPLRIAEESLTPWELQALEVLTFQLGVQVKVVEAALKKLRREGDAQVRDALVEQAARSAEALDLIRAIVGETPEHWKQSRRGLRR